MCYVAPYLEGASTQPTLEYSPALESSKPKILSHLETPSPLSKLLYYFRYPSKLSKRRFTESKKPVS